MTEGDPSTETIHGFLTSGDWKVTFSGTVVAAGYKLARARQVTRCTAERLDTGDVEITAAVIDQSGHQNETTIALWLENGRLQVDTSCTCPVGTCCEHAAAALEHLARPGRLEKAFGELRGEPTVATLTENIQDSPPGTGIGKKAAFQLHIQRRPEGDGYDWLPETFATAYAVYDANKYPLDPAGNIGKPRDRAAEMTALNTLYALDLLPGAEEPPPSLKKLSPPPHEGTLWSPNNKEWQPTLYWQRFQHEAVPALENRGWQVTIAHDAALKPLRFNASSWRAEFVDEGKGWFSLSAGFEINGERMDLQPILATLVEYNFLELTKDMPGGQEFLVFLADGRGITLPIGRFRRILTHLGELVDYKFTGKPLKLHKVEAATITEALSEDDPNFSPPPEIASLKIHHSPFTIHHSEVPQGLRATLRSYQREGYEWMQFLAIHGLHGILADDMGLGKTMQTLTHILAEKEKGNMLPNLVVAPTSVVENWQREAAQFAPSLKVTILQGAHRHHRFTELDGTDIALTSYALLHRDLDRFSDQAFHLLVLDEAQHIKNPGAQVSQAVRQLNARHRLCLSGTPVENHLGELWSLFDFLMPGLLGDSESFTQTFRTPIEKAGSQSRADALATKVGPLILRRTKDQVATELPPKTEIPHFIELGTDEKDLYETVRSTMDKHVRQALAIRGQEAQIVFLDALLKLRQICCHPSLVNSNFQTPNTNPQTSSKFDYLTDLLETLKEENRKVLVFSQFTSMLDIIEEYLIGQETTYLKLTGASKNRQDLVERFQAGEAEVFLISLKAGGTGLTLTNADTVIHYDPWWNPAVENQATDRAYRIGQDKPVFVHKLICKGTVEQRIQQMQKKKSGISDSILTASLTQLKLDDDVLTRLLAPIDEDASRHGHGN
ncbi:MAG: DEAD/DEAH box helicase [Akkermansiaceae bacterium]|nr:DEAD/DEAH box helicase [Akkermansiaceae bacterium]